MQGGDYSGLTEITDKCKKMKLLNVTGCTAITERNVNDAKLLLPLCDVQWPQEKVWVELNFFSSRIISEYCSEAKL